MWYFESLLSFYGFPYENFKLIYFEIVEVHYIYQIYIQYWIPSVLKLLDLAHLKNKDRNPLSKESAK